MVPTNKTNRLLFDYFLAGSIILLMGVFSVVADDIEIVLPELAALCAGCFLYKKPSWNSNPNSLFVLPSITAFIGFFINKLHTPLALKIALVLLLIFLLFYFSKNVLAPAIATGLLPIITNCHSVYFLVSTLVFTFVLAVIVKLKYQSTDKISKDIIPFRTFFAYFTILIIWLSFCYYNNYHFMLAIPPVIVIGLEMITMPEIKFKQVAVKTLVLVASSLIGGFIYLYIDGLLMVLLVNFVSVALFLILSKQKMAPAFAIALLPIVLKNQQPFHFAVYVFIICCAVLGGAFIAKSMRLKYVSILHKKST